jgi:hypothetical protein
MIGMNILPENIFASWLPPSLRSHPGHDMVARIGHVVGCPSDGHGFLPALRFAIHCFFRLAERKNIPNLGEFLTATSAFAEALERNPDIGDQVRTRPDAGAEGAHYRLFFERPAEHHDPMTAARIERLVGALLLWHVAERRELNAHRAAPLMTLTRSGTAQHRGVRHWVAFAHELGDDPSSLLQHPGSGYAPIQELLDCLIPILGALPPAPTFSQTHEEGNDAPINEEFAEYGEPPVDSPTSITKVEWNANAEPGKLVLWHWARSLHASIAEIAGIYGWNELSPLELREATSRAVAILRDPDHCDRPFAAIAILSLLTAQPPARLCSLPLVENGDAWLSLERRAYCWSIKQLVKRDPADPRIAASGFQPSQIVVVYLPLILCEALPAVTPTGAMTVRDLLPPGISERDVDMHVARILTAHVESSDPRRPFNARFAYSLGAAILHVTGNSFLAGLISMSFCLLGPAEVYYACVSARSIHRALRLTYDFLGLGQPAPMSGSQWIGSPLAPTPQAYSRALHALHRRYCECIAAVSPRMAPDRFIELFNRSAACAAAAFVMMAAHRGSTLPRLNWGGLYADPDCLQFCDKVTKTTTDRIQPKTDRIRTLLDAVRRNIRSAANRFRSADPAFADLLDEIVDLRHARRPVFFLIARTAASSSRFVLRPIVTADIAALLDEQGISTNGGRHFLISQLIARRAPALLVRMLSGHSRSGGQPFVPWSGVAPLEAGAALRPILDRIQKNLPSEWPAMSSAPMPATGLVATRRPKHSISNDMIDAFCNRRQLTERRAESFSEHTLAFRAIAVRLRSELLRGAPELAPWPAVLLCLCIVDGITVLVALRAAWQAVVDRNFRGARQALILEFRSAHDRAVSMPLLPLTKLYMAEALASAIASFDSAAAELAAWLASRIPSHRWSMNATEALVALCDVGQSAATVECPPILCFAPLSALDAATLSHTSIARHVFQRAAITLSRPIGLVHRTAGRDRHYGSAQRVLSILNKFADSSKHGEEASRKSKFIRALEDWRREAWLPAPEAEGYVEYLLAEAQNSGDLGEPLRLSSLSTYVSETRAQIEKLPGLHPLDFEPDQWLEMLEAFIRDHEGSDLSRALSIIRRYARYWRSKGAAVPHGFFVGEHASEKPAHPPLRAAESFLPLHQRDLLVQAVKDRFEPGSLLQEQGALLAELLLAFPLRRNEPVFIRHCDFNPSTGILAIAPSGFAHLKGSGANRSRAIALGEALIAQLHALRERISAADHRRQYFFLDADNASRQGVDEVLAALSDLLRRLTGEASMRIHSLRGSAECYLAYPDLDALVAAMAANKAPGPDPLPIAERLTRMTRAAFEAGHHPLTAMQHYFSPWPILAHGYRRRLHATWHPSGLLADRMPGISREALRQMISRHSKTGDDIWDSLGNLAADRICAESLQDCLVADPAPPRQGAGPQLVAEDSLADVTRYVALRLIGCPTVKAIDVAGVSPRYAAQFNAFLSSVPPMAIPRLSDDAAAMLGSDFGSAVANRLASQSDTKWLLAVVESLRETERSAPTPVADIVLAATRLSDCLPGSHTVALLPEEASDVDVIAIQTRAAVQTILVKPASRKAKRRFRLLVTPLRVRSARSAGECTGVVHVLLLARLAAIFLRRNEKNGNEI